MKKITKKSSPQWFEQWKRDFETTNGHKPHYEGDFSDDSPASFSRRQKLRKQLVAEQGCICCYCMSRINVHDSHIEHFGPKKDFGELDLDYNNLFASCNGNYHNEDYCGHKKDDSRADVAQKMIEYFGLKSYHLERNRKEAIEASEVFDEAEYTDDDIRQFITYYYQKEEGNYIPYCKAIVDCLQRMI